jgi:hypothetical protein
MQSASTVHEKLTKERNQLQRRLDKLVAFCRSPEFQEFLPPYRELLQEQRNAMAAYLNVLNSRIYMHASEAEAR